MKNIFKKTLKFISSRLVYLIIGIFLAVSITYVYAAWDDAKTGDSDQLSQSNWNALVDEVHNKCGSNCDALATAATVADNILIESNWNNLIDLASSTLVDCTDNNTGKYFINQTSKSALDADLATGNIKSGTTIFGVAGNSNVVDTSSGNIDSTARIRSGYTAWSDGTSYSGVLANCTNGVNACYADGGYWASATCSSQGSQSCWPTGTYYAGTTCSGTAGQQTCYVGASGEWHDNECADSTTTAKTECYVDDTAKYVDTNACLATSNTGNCFMNTATFTAMDADLVDENIVSGKTIFGVTGTAVEVACYSGGVPQTTIWGAGTYACPPNSRCSAGSCIICGGWVSAGYCWYQGDYLQGCTDVCEAHQGLDGGNCDWVNDPTNCSTCQHFFPTLGCYGTSPYGPVNSNNSGCYYHTDGGAGCGVCNYCTHLCACNS